MRSRAGDPDRRSSTGWTPVADVCETDESFVIIAELPGVDRDDIDVSATAREVLIRGARRGPGCEPAQFVRLERGHGRFARRFAFATPLDVNAVTADLQDGVLTVTVPKAASARGRRIEVE
jgi:HSP20 family protein